MKQSRLSAIITSKKKEIKLEFAILFDPEKEPIETLGTEWIEEGLTEAFWENENLFPDASFEEFGGFELSFELDGEKVAYPFALDVNAVMLQIFKNKIDESTEVF